VSLVLTQLAPDHCGYHPGVGDHAYPAASQANLWPTSHCTYPCAPSHVRL